MSRIFLSFAGLKFVFFCAAAIFLLIRRAGQKRAGTYRPLHRENAMGGDSLTVPPGLPDSRRMPIDSSTIGVTWRERQALPRNRA